MLQKSVLENNKIGYFQTPGSELWKLGWSLAFFLFFHYSYSLPPSLPQRGDQTFAIPTPIHRWRGKKEPPLFWMTQDAVEICVICLHLAGTSHHRHLWWYFYASKSSFTLFLLLLFFYFLTSWQGSWFSDQESNSGPLQWKHGVPFSRGSSQH